MRGMDGNKVSGALPFWGKVLGVLASMALLCFAPLGLAQSSGKEIIAEIKPVGNQNIATEKIMRYIHARPGMEYNQSAIYSDVIRLTGSRMFRNVRVREEHTPRGVVVYFQLEEYPNLVREVVFKNAHHVGKKDLESMVRVHKGMPLDPVTNRNACLEIQDFLKKKGRYFANVFLEEGDKASDTRVVFNISEGPTVRVRAIRFEGNETLATDARLRTQTDSSRSFFGMIGGVFNPAMVDADVLKLEEYYQNNGYRDIKVTRELIFSQDFSQVDIVFHLLEGQRYRVGAIQLEGTKVLPQTQVNSIIQAKSGEYYNEGVVSADVRNITDLYGWRGYKAVVNKDVFQDPNQPGVVNVQLAVQESQPAKVGQIIIVGNEVTQDRVIRRLLGLYPGQTLRYPELRIAEANLARANIFEMNPEKGGPPSVSIIDSPVDTEYKDVLVKIQETHTGSLMFGAGVNSNAGLVGSIVLNERNFDITRLPTSWADVTEGRAFRGAGQEFRMEAVPGTELQRYTISWREPFLFDRPYSLTTSALYYNRYFNEYLETRYGGRITLAHQIDRNWSVNGGVRIENIGVSDVSIFAPVDYTSVVGDNFLIAPRIGATWDNRDSFLRPSEGGIINASYEQCFGAFTFPLVNIDGSRYFTTFKRPDGSGKHVLAAHAQVSWAGDNTPVYERFFAGGYQSLRGFQFRGVGPQVNGFMVGGDFMLLASLEYQIPVLANDNLYLVGFVDTGTVESNVSIQDYRVSAGFGLRIAIPMMGPVPIALDFGFPIVRAPGDREQIFNFWVGMFR